MALEREWERMLRDVISEVLETMFFAMVDFGQHPAEAGSFGYASEIDLLNRGERISISLRVNEEFARMITANFLGLQENEVGDDDLDDCLKELANMVGGGYQARAAVPGGQLGIPRLSMAGPYSEGGDPENSRLDFGYFGEPVGSAFLNYRGLD